MQMANIINTKENPVNVANVKRQNIISKIRGKTINGNDTSYIVVSADVSDYLFIYAVIQTDSSHSFALDMYPIYSDKTENVKNFPYTRIIENTGTTARTDWIETYSDSIHLELSNFSDTSHVYDVTIFGVR